MPRWTPRSPRRRRRSMTTEIKPCPFCGSEAIPGWTWDFHQVVACRACSATGSWCEAESEAIAAWNAAPRLTPAEKAVIDAAVVRGELIGNAFASDSECPAAKTWCAHEKQTRIVLDDA